MVQLLVKMWWINAIFLLIAISSEAQQGSQCSSTHNCMPHQTCYSGYCKCDPGFVKGRLFCWPVRKYGGVCYFDEQCIDHRMSCQVDDKDNNIKRCLCARFHVWNNETEECVQQVNITTVLANIYEQGDTGRMNTDSEHEMFIKISVVGLCAVIALCIFIVSCIAYGCCSCTRTHAHKKDMQPVMTTCPPICPLHKVPLLKEEEEQKDKWKDMACNMTDFDDIDI